jgi:hypothetical protein
VRLKVHKVSQRDAGQRPSGSEPQLAEKDTNQRARTRFGAICGPRWRSGGGVSADGRFVGPSCAQPSYCRSLPYRSPTCANCYLFCQAVYLIGALGRYRYRKQAQHGSAVGDALSALDVWLHAKHMFTEGTHDLPSSRCHNPCRWKAAGVFPCFSMA